MSLEQVGEAGTPQVKPALNDLGTNISCICHLVNIRTVSDKSPMWVSSVTGKSVRYRRL